MKELISRKNPDIIQITEVLPKQKIKIDPKLEFDIPGYELFINENPSRGIIMYIKQSLKPSKCDELNSCDFHESLWCNINIDSVSLLLGCIYRNTSIDLAQSTEHLVNLLQKLNSIKHEQVIITGDFNYPNINWKNANNTSDSVLKITF